MYSKEMIFEHFEKLSLPFRDKGTILRENVELKLLRFIWKICQVHL